MQLSRQAFLQGAGAALAALPMLGAAPATHAQPTADEALRLLLQGNERYRNGALSYGNLNSRRMQVANGQQPFAMILSCADSRVPPELIFDRTLGDLFVVRLAGNYPVSGGIGSFEYAFEHFATPLLMVLGHSSCGAVHATVDALKKPGGEAPGDIKDIVDAIAPSVKKVLGKPGNVYQNAIRQNALDGAATLRTQRPILQKAVAAKKLRIVSAVYDLKSGKVSLIE